jgi:hypothetical protein
MSNLVDNGAVIAALGSAVAHGNENVAQIPALLVQIVDDDRWRHFITKMGDEVEYERFADFAATPPTAGLGISIEVLRRLVQDDPVAVDALDRATQGKQGQRTDLLDNVQEVKAPTGNSEAATVRRLRKDRPDLHAQYLANEISANAAAIQAGFRPKTFTVRADKPESIVGTLRRQLDPETLAMVTKLLSEEN